MSQRARRRIVSPRLCAVAGVLILGAVTAVAVEHGPPTYLESALVILVARDTPGLDSPGSTVGGSLITTSATMVQSLTSSRSVSQIREAGGTSNYSLALVNFYNLDYPEYSYPFATLTATAGTIAAARLTFSAVLRTFRRQLADRQAGVPSSGQISVRVVGDTGPVLQPGSAKRSLAGLALLAVIAAVMVSRLARRHAARLARWPGLAR
jgi:hypothetical protein